VLRDLSAHHHRPSLSPHTRHIIHITSSSHITASHFTRAVGCCYRWTSSPLSTPLSHAGKTNRVSVQYIWDFSLQLHVFVISHAFGTCCAFHCASMVFCLVKLQLLCVYLSEAYNTSHATTFCISLTRVSPRSARSYDKERDSVRSMLAAFHR
jgi:hypothetical protein